MTEKETIEKYRNDILNNQNSIIEYITYNSHYLNKLPISETPKAFFK